MENILQDIRYGLRKMRQNPGFTSIVVIILAFGIGMNTTILSLLNAFLFRPLPYKDAERLVFIQEINPRTGANGTIAVANFLDWKNQNHVFDEMAVFAGDDAVLTGSGEPERLHGIRVSSDMISLLGVKPMLGRPFLPEEDLQGGDPAVLLGHSFWQRRFGSNPNIVAQKLILNGHPRIIAGILPAHFKLAYVLGFEPEYWAPYPLNNPESRASRSSLALAHLKPGVSMEQAQADMTLLAGRLEQQYPESNKGWGALVTDLRGSVDPAVYLFLLIVIGAVLGIVCVNVTNLLLARSAARGKEIAIRMALGASRRRLARQLLTESFLLAILGGGLGIWVAYWTLDLIAALGAGTNLAILDLQIDARILWATLLISLLAGLMVGLAPALQSTRVDLNHALKETGQSFSGVSSRNRFKRLLVISEVALSMMLLIGAGLAVKSIFSLLQVDPGFKPQRVLTMDIPLNDQRYPSDQQKTAFFEQALSRLETRSGIEAVAVTSAIPTRGPFNPFSIGGHPQPTPGEEPSARLTVVSSRYFEALSVPLRAGRFFTSLDTSNALPVAIINETLAHKYFKQENPLGRQISVTGAVRTVVGVIGDQRNVPLDLVPAPEIHVPYLQAPAGYMRLVVRSSLSNPLNLATALKKEIQTLDPDQLVDNIQTMEKALSVNMGVIKMGTSLLGALALGALFLTALGIYGVMSFLVLQRTREFGIRMALGGQQRDVLRLANKQGLSMVIVGIIPGIAASLAVGRLLANRIHGLSPFEPFVLIGVVLFFLAVALTACYIPARRATKVEPMVALRYE